MDRQVPHAAVGQMLHPAFTPPGRVTLPRVYIHCTRFADKKPFAQFDTATKGTPGWQNFDLDASHSPNVTAPSALVDVLQRSLAG